MLLRLGVVDVTCPECGFPLATTDGCPACEEDRRDMAILAVTSIGGTVVWWDARSAYPEPIWAWCPNEGRMRAYRSDACPSCGVLG